MKNLVIILMGALVALFMSGCSMKVEYQPEFVNGVLKNNLNKVEQTVVVKQHASNVIGKRPYASHRGAVVTTNIDVSKLGDEITRDFFEQYFTVVQYGNKNNDGLLLDFQIEDFVFMNKELDNGVTFTLDINVVAEYKNRVILNKKVTHEFDSGWIIDLIQIRSPKDYRREIFHKAVMSALETKVKPDLLKALEENK